MLSDEGGDGPVIIPKFKRELSIGSVAVIVTWVVAIALWAAQVNGLASQIQDLKQSTNSELHSLQAQIANLPTEAVQISVLQQHANQVDGALSAVNQSIFDLKTQAIQNKADIENIERASSITLKRR